MQASIFGLIYHTHAATAQLLQDAVMGDGLADHADKHSLLGRNPTLARRASQTAMPVVDTRPPVVASPKSCVSRIVVQEQTGLEREALARVHRGIFGERSG